jgi:hypothetical protein
MKIEWNKVTKFSQFVAIVLFVAVFFVGFFVGRRGDPNNPTYKDCIITTR